MPDEIDALVTFYESWQQDGTGPDGLPLYREVVIIRKAKPPLLQVEGEATEEDFEQFRDAFRAFEKRRQARKPVEGYPLVMWPVVTPAEIQMLAARDIVTVEQLAGLAGSKKEVLPQIRELAGRAAKLIELQKAGGKFEAIIQDLSAQLDAIVEQLREANTTISAQNAMIDMLKMSAAPKAVA